MNKSDLIKEIAKETMVHRRYVADVVDAYEKIICDAMRRDETVVLYGFLKFERKKRKGHKSNDLNRDGFLYVPDYETVKVTPGDSLKKSVR